MAKKTIAIIGATEDNGIELSVALAKTNYRLLLFGHDKRRLESIIEAIGESTVSAEIEYMNCMIDASWEADIIISVVDRHLEKKIAKKIRDFATQKIVISIIDPVIMPTGHPKPTEFNDAEELQKLLPNSKVVKVFNTKKTGITQLTEAAGEPFALSSHYDNHDTLQAVIEIIAKAGFHPLTGGQLPASGILKN